jgi:hypothetical protein
MWAYVALVAFAGLIFAYSALVSKNIFNLPQILHIVLCLLGLKGVSDYNLNLKRNENKNNINSLIENAKKNNAT